MKVRGGSLFRPISVRLPSFTLVLLLLGLLLSGESLRAQISQEEFAQRRAALAEAVGEGVILALGSAEPPQDYLPFSQNSPFRYLTGFRETNAALMMIQDGGERTEILFVNPRDPVRETWEGYRLGPEGAERELGIPARVVGELGHVADSLLAGVDTLSVVAPWEPEASVLNHDTQRLKRLLEGHEGVVVEDVTSRVSQLRARKSPAELELIRMSVAITEAAHRDAMQLIRPGLNEFEVQALVEYTFRRYGAERPAFESIVGSGLNSTVLHYNVNDRFMEDGDVLLVDIGASYRGYAADVTRTYPVNGTFSEAQREIYQLVRDAQAAAEEEAAPGVPRERMSRAANRVLARGLARLGLIEAPDATYDCEVPGHGLVECPQLRLFYMHSLGHGIGLDVHDPWPGTLEPGTAFTIEPGIYVRPNLPEILPETPGNRQMMERIRPAFERYRSIGVRIEDDYLVTEEGVEWISRVAREIDEIEARMAEEWDGPSPRRDDWVERYRDFR